MQADASIFRLLRLFLGALEQHPEIDAHAQALPSAQDGEDSSVHPSPKRQRVQGKVAAGAAGPQILLPATKPTASVSPAAAAVAHTEIEILSSERIDAGCSLWDMSVIENYATAMVTAGLLPIACAVLRDCSEAGELHSVSGSLGGSMSRDKGRDNTSAAARGFDAAELDAAGGSESQSCDDRVQSGQQKEVTDYANHGTKESMQAGARTGIGTGTRSGAESQAGLELKSSKVPTKRTQRGGTTDDEMPRSDAAQATSAVMMNALDAERLREITCGLLANACSHRSLR